MPKVIKEFKGRYLPLISGYVILCQADDGQFYVGEIKHNIDVDNTTRNFDNLGDAQSFYNEVVKLGYFPRKEGK